MYRVIQLDDGDRIDTVNSDQRTVELLRFF